MNAALSVIVAAALLGGAPQDNQAPWPNAEAVAKAERDVSTLYGERTAKAKKAADKLALGRELLKVGEETGDDPAAQLVLFYQARDLGMEAKDWPLTLEAITRIVGRFKIDGPTEPAQQIGRGDTLRADAKKKPAGERLTTQLEAGEWYVRAKQGSKGIQAKIAEKRLDEVGRLIEGNHRAKSIHSGGTKTAVVGGESGGTFEDVESDAKIVGFNVTTGQFGGNAVVKSLQAIYSSGRRQWMSKRYGSPGGLNTSVRAKAGYAVAGIAAKGGLRLDGFKVIFMRDRKDRLDASDHYESQWVGGKGGGQESLLGASGRFVIGIYGSCGDDVDCIGLVLAD